jgi:hypothetical protein
VPRQRAKRRAETTPGPVRPVQGRAGAHPGRGTVPEPMSRRVLPALLSLLLPGLGQAARRRFVAGLVCFVAAFVPYLVFAVLLNQRYGVSGELFSLPFLHAREPIRPPAEYWALFGLGVVAHLAAVLDASWRYEPDGREAADGTQRGAVPDDPAG